MMGRSSLASRWLIALFLGALMLLMAQPAASTPIARFGLPFAETPGPDTWLLGQPSRLAHLPAGAVPIAPARACTSALTSQQPVALQSSPSATAWCSR